MSCVALLRSIVVLIVAALLSGCATRSGFDYVAVMQKVGSPAPGHSRIVLMSEKAWGGLNHANCALKIDGIETSVLVPGSFVYIDRPAGRHEIVASQILFPGETKREITTAPGRTYFFVARTSDRNKAITGVSMVAGLAGALVATAATAGNENPGPIDFFPLDEAAARTTLAELQLAK
jgi:hypothetical protein